MYLFNLLLSYKVIIHREQYSFSLTIEWKIFSFLFMQILYKNELKKKKKKLSTVAVFKLKGGVSHSCSEETIKLYIFQRPIGVARAEISHVVSHPSNRILVLIFPCSCFSPPFTWHNFDTKFFILDSFLNGFLLFFFSLSFSFFFFPSFLNRIQQELRRSNLIYV